MRYVAFIRLTEDSTPPYQVEGFNGMWTGAIVLPFESARKLFAAMHGPPAKVQLTVETTPRVGPPAAVPPFFDFQVERQAGPLPGSPSPSYPESLRMANTQGEVLMQFVIDTMGRVEMRTVKVLKGTDPLFVQAVHEALPQMRFRPAEIKGRKVRELVQEPFAFNLNR
jgi:TonB family protein